MAETKEVRVDCPCCRARLAVDVRTSRVVRWSPENAEAGTERRTHDFDEVSRRVEERQGSAATAFDAGLQREKSRARDLDEMFDEASRKLKDGDAEGE